MIPLILLLAAAAAFPDTVALKSGVLVDCDVLSKSEQILKVHSPRFQRVMVIERDQIDYVEMGGVRQTFESLNLEKTDYNPKFRVSPRFERRKFSIRQPPLPLGDIFDSAQAGNLDSTLADHRRLNLFFNAPARWGSLGFGYFYAFRLQPPDVSKFKKAGFDYQGTLMDLPQLCAQIRRNFQGGLGTLVMDFGYGKKIFSHDADGAIREAAFMRFASVGYVVCFNRWLLSPGLSGSLLFAKAGVIRYPADTSEQMLNFSLYKYGVIPTLGLDLNFYDVLDLNFSVDVWNVRRSYLRLLFLMPFLQ